MEAININNKEYKFVIGNPKDDHYRRSFNALTEKTFGFNFEQWYQSGYWTNQYLPYSFLDGETVVANVSVNFMDIDVYGNKRKLIQVGTVMTDSAYRDQGLIRALLNKVIADWQAKCEYLYLFANDSVLDFYPKFGFKALNQNQFTKTVIKKVKERSAIKLNMSDESNRVLVYQKANTSTSNSKISMIGNAELVMFYCLSFMKDNLYYIEEFETVVVAHHEHDVLEVFGVFCTEGVPLDIILDYMANEDTNKVKLYFTPQDTDSYLITPLVGEGTLFILGEDPDLLRNTPFMFPTLSHA
ncbi:MAG: GNAT family N-acetyltransferase [Clostridiaceae bacterium]